MLLARHVAIDLIAFKKIDELAFLPRFHQKHYFQIKIIRQCHLTFFVLMKKWVYTVFYPVIKIHIKIICFNEIHFV